MRIDRVDHLVLTVADIAATCAFYADVLGMRVATSAAGRTALLFGRQKINLHAVDHTFDPKAAHPTQGSADLCLITGTPVETVVAHMRARGIAIEGGPVARSGAAGPILSVYVRDPDGNLVEIATARDA